MRVLRVSLQCHDHLVDVAPELLQALNQMHESLPADSGSDIRLSRRLVAWRLLEAARHRVAWMLLATALVAWPMLASAHHRLAWLLPATAHHLVAWLWQEVRVVPPAPGVRAVPL